MKILILINFFNYFKKVSRYKREKSIFINYYNKYCFFKLNKLFNKLSKQYGNNVEFKVIINGELDLNIYDKTKIELVSDYRQKIDRDEYLRLIKKVREKTKLNLATIFRNLINLKTFHYKGILIAKLIEVELMQYIFENFGEFETLKKILELENYDKAIIFNYNPNFTNYIKNLRYKFKNIDAYQDSFLNIINKKLKWLKLLYLFPILKSSLFGQFFKRSNIKNLNYSQNKKSILFFGFKPGKTKMSPFQSVKPIYDALKRDNITNPIYYTWIDNFITLKEFRELLSFLFQIRKIYRENKKKITSKMEYDSFSLNDVIKEFFEFDLFFWNVISFTHLKKFIQFIKCYPPDLIITTHFWEVGMRIMLNYSKIHNIPSLYVPLGANIIFEELVTISDLSHITVAGEKEKEYFIQIGEPSHKITVIGRARYDDFYKGKLKRIDEVKDMFDGRVYKFNPNKFTILLASNIYNDNSNEITIKEVIKLLKDLNLIDNLIIKLHPKETGLVEKKIVEELKVNPIIIQNYNIFEVIKSCNLLLSRISTTILESMINGTPAILLDLNNESFDAYYRLQFLEEDSIIKIREPKILAIKINELIKYPEYYNKYSKILKDISKRYSFYDENESSLEKIINLIYNILGLKK